MRKPSELWLTIILFCSSINLLWADSTLISTRTDSPPTIDGIANDTAWSSPPPISINDSIDLRQIEIRSVHTHTNIYVQVRFPDIKENRQHKTLYWDAATELYKTGPTREDVFVFKWSMEDKPIDLSLSSTQPYQADIWYWKAFRTDPTGFADDKIQYYRVEKIQKSRVLRAKNGRRFYLKRAGDSGRPAYKVELHGGFLSAYINKYSHQKPSKSRADVRAKGVWKAGYWTVEFSRKLDTGRNDDIAFDLQNTYQFGVSLYEIAGRKPDQNLEKPNFGSGDVSQTLQLIFK